MDCCFTRDNHWFRYRTCAIIPNGDSILMVTNPKVDYYYSVGGGVMLGESAEDAVRREVLEETGTNMEIERLAAIHENFFQGTMDNSELLCHELALYFLMRPAGLDDLRDRGIAMDGSREHLVWVPLSDFGKEKIYPAFLPQALSSDRVLHILTRE